MLAQLKIWQKLLGICIALSIPLMVVLIKYMGEANYKRDFAQNEINGDEYNLSLGLAMGKAVELQVLASRAKAEPTIGDKIHATVDQIDRELKKVTELEEKVGLSETYGKEFRSTEFLGRAKNAWGDVKTNLPPSKAYKPAVHEQFYSAVVSLYGQVGDQSKLILDPDLDSYYVMDLTLLKYPAGIRQIGDILIMAEGTLDRRTVTNEEKAELIGRLSVLRSNIEEAEADLRKAFRENNREDKDYAGSLGTLQKTLDGPFREFLKEARNFIDVTDKRIVHSARLEITNGEYAAIAQRALTAYVKLYEFAMPKLDEVLKARMDAVTRSRNLTLVSVFFVLAIAAALVYIVIQAINRQLRNALQIATRLAEGDVTLRVEVSSQDEIGQLLQAMAAVVAYLKDMGTIADAIAAGNLTARVNPRSQTDGFGNAFKTMIENLREIVATLQKSAQLLTESVANLNNSASEQSQTITRQAAALQETQVTAQEIKQTSLLAAQKAEDVLKMAERADEVSRQGETAIEQSLVGLGEIRGSVDEIAQRIMELNERTRQIGGITDTVKDLADQSNMLALNAAIEAVRSGEHGRGFAVVAREIRNLADQSIQATSKVREILEDIGGAIRRAVSITERGAQKMEGGLSQVKASGDNLRELSNIVKDNSAAGRQIAAAVSQQNAGITQIFTALTDQTQMMDETVKRLSATNQATTVVRDVTQRVSDVVKRYRV